MEHGQRVLRPVRGRRARLDGALLRHVPAGAAQLRGGGPAAVGLCRGVLSGDDPLQRSQDPARGCGQGIPGRHARPQAGLGAVGTGHCRVLVRCAIARGGLHARQAEGLGLPTGTLHLDQPLRHGRTGHRPAVLVALPLQWRSRLDARKRLPDPARRHGVLPEPGWRKRPGRVLPHLSDEQAREFLGRARQHHRLGRDPRRRPAGHPRCGTAGRGCRAAREVEGVHRPPRAVPDGQRAGSAGAHRRRQVRGHLGGGAQGRRGRLPQRRGRMGRSDLPLRTRHPGHERPGLARRGLAHASGTCSTRAVPGIAIPSARRGSGTWSGSRPACFRVVPL